MARVSGKYVPSDHIYWLVVAGKLFAIDFAQ